MSPTAVIEISRTPNPYPRQGVQADGHGIPRYTELPESLIAMLARHVETGPDVEAVVEVGGQRLAYRQLWDRAARVAGGLRAAGLARGDRVAVRYPAGVNWVLAFWGTLMAGGVAVVGRMRPPERRAAGQATGPGDPASTRTAAAAPRTAAPSPTRHPQREPPESLAPSRPHSPAARSYRPRTQYTPQIGPHAGCRLGISQTRTRSSQAEGSGMGNPPAPGHRDRGDHQ